MKTRHILAALAASFLLTGCFQEFHDRQAWDVPVGYLVPVLQWEDPDDAGIDIHDLVIVVQGPGLSYSRHYANVREAAADVLPLPVGECGIVAVANASGADGYSLSGLPPTKADGDLTVGVGITGNMPRRQAYAGACRLSVVENKVYSGQLLLQDLLPALTVNMTNIPDEATVEVFFVNMAKEVLLSPQESDPVRPADHAFDVISVCSLSASASSSNTLVLPTFIGMPTCLFVVDIILDGEHHKFVGNVSRMDCGRRYTLNLDFNDYELEESLDPGSFDINDWISQGDSVDGDVFKPAQ